MDLFYSATSITGGNGALTPFWEAPWLNERNPGEVAPLIFEVSSSKKWKINKALLDNSWVTKIKMDENFTFDHVAQLVDLWILVQDVNLDHDVDDEITWRLTTNGQYTTTSTYQVQFFGATFTNRKRVVWKPWTPTKVKLLHG